MCLRNKLGASIEKLVDTTLYQYARFFFWSAVFTVLISAIGIALGESGYYLDFLSVLVQNPSNGFFGNSLTLILNVISIVFLVVIFLVQNANQNYSNRLASVIFTDQLFLGSVLFITIASLYNISGSYFEWQAPWTTLSFAFSIASVQIIISLIFLAGYFIDMSNIISYVTAKYEGEVDSEKLYKAGWGGILLPNKDQINQLTTDVRLISSTCIKAIEENNHALAETCLNSLKHITRKYLQETSSEEVNADFLQDLNSEFDFIGSAAFEDHSRQKHAENVVETVGDIGVMVTLARELGSPGGIWAELLKRLFYDSVDFDRNVVGPTVIDKLGDMCVVAITQEDFDSFGLYLDELIEIGQTCIQRDETYFNNLVMNVSQEFQTCYIQLIRVLCTSGATSDYDLEQLINEYASIFLKAKSEFGTLSRDGLFSSIQNPTQPFSLKLAVAFLQHSHLDLRVQNKLGTSLVLFIEFLGLIGEDIETNERKLYQIYTGVLYSIVQFAPLREDLKFSLLLELNEKWCSLVSNSYRFYIESGNSVDSSLNQRMTDFYAITIYFYRHHPDALSYLIEPLVEEYVELKQNYPKGNRGYEHNRKRLYKELKLIGAWIDEVCGIDNVSPELKEILIEDFYEIDHSANRIALPELRKYGFPTNRYDYRGGWWLRPDPVWSNQFQENISDLMNGGDSEHYKEFHQKLRANYRIRKAVTTASILNDQIP